MNAFRLKKQLWRRWRRWKNAPWVGAACIALTVLGWRGMQVPQQLSGLLSTAEWNMPEAAGTFYDPLQGGDPDNSIAALAAVHHNAGDTGEDGSITLERAKLLETVRSEGISRVVHLKTVYVTGEEIQTLPGLKSPGQQKALIKDRPGWSGWISGEGDLWLEKRVNDLSPLTKQNAYIGVDEEGNLSLFKGRPEGEEVLKTFFQMDMGSMKSSLPEEVWKQLHDGIRVQDIEEYNSVLSTFSDYARDSAEQVMQAE
ncbi:BofC C-terminal domain-containing protein [Paenibacillus typhae]|uniref:Forespore regulator of the sigma-K checkpoint n=1 Tax=Paenibacillus typhae TaxID=1174501 RepID=A0A1G8IEJ5_9BACL|nr:BofC C-terminal domain-containing protein [Paenibacillus typhae]SDI17335.1 forespore regulator of the sigma-K checkpoint [Paenibacillus typhae]